MKATVNGKMFAEAVALTKTVVGPTQTLPILSCVRVTFSGDGAELYATNLEQALTVGLPAEVAEPGIAAVNAAKLQAVSHELAGEMPTVLANGTGGLTLETDGARFTLATLVHDDMPPPGGLEKPERLVLDAKAVRAALEATVFAVSKDTTRYALQGVHVAFGEGRARFTATDGHRLAQSVLPAVEVAAPREVLVPGEAVKTMLVLLRRAEQVEIALDPKALDVTAGRLQFRTRLLEGQFPNTAQVLATANAGPHVGQVDGPAFQRALRRADLLNDQPNRPVRLKFEANRLTVLVQNVEVGSGETTVPCTWSAAPLAIGFNAKYLLDWCGFVSGPVTVRGKDAMHPMLLTAEGAPLYVVMPMRLG